MDRETTNKYLKTHGILPESRFGQNFLCDEDIIASIVEIAGIRKGDRVLEIGPGIGALTRPLSAMDIDLTSVEIDKRLSEILREDPDINAQVIDSDFLKLTDYNPEAFDIVISNLPYYVMTDIMKKLFAECINARKMVFMVEEEATARIDASPKTKQYGPLAVLTAVYGVYSEELTVQGSCFIPAPRTTSAVISLTRSEDAKALNKEFVRFVDTCFSMRRKKLTNSLKAYPKEIVEGAYSKLGLDPNVRAEELAPEVFISLYDAIIN